MMNKLALIPARGGSKRIPKKNIKLFLNKPILAYSIEAALECDLFDEVMVSTDDEEIAEAALKYGAKVPFCRSKELSDDNAMLFEVIEEVLNEYEKDKVSFEYLCCLLPTAPLISEKILIEGFNILKTKGYDNVFPVGKFSYPPERGLYLKNKKLVWADPDNFKKRSQDIQEMYYDSGQFYWMNVNAFKRDKLILNDNTGTLKLSELEIQDIDNIEDWKIAEFKYKYLNNLLT